MLKQSHSMSNNNVLSVIVQWQCAFCWGLCWTRWKHRIKHSELLQSWLCSEQTGRSKEYKMHHLWWFLTGGRAVLAQKKANVRSCFLIHKNDDNRYVEFRIAQKAVNKAMMAKKNCSVACKKTNLFWIQWYIQEIEQ